MLLLITREMVVTILKHPDYHSLFLSFNAEITKESQRGGEGLGILAAERL